jgi:tetratricopeptide (TPR) repeat protein
MARDLQGLETSGTGESIAALDGAVSDYYAWKGDPIATLKAAASADPSFVLGPTTIASLYALNGVRGDDPRVLLALAQGSRAAQSGSSRERRHLEAARRWASGSITGAVDLWEDILLDFPTDALALRFAHDTYFYLGHSEAIRDSVARVLPSWDKKNPNYGFVLGQYAFGLEETGALRQAEDAGRQAIAINAEDGWAVHAVAHVLETESRQAEGIEFLRASRRDWRRAHALAVHNGWHLALYLLEQGGFSEIIEDYDTHVAPKIGDDSLLDLVDAASLLWRLELAGGEVGSRWTPLAAQWLTHVDDHVLVFNDLHIAMAVSRAGDSSGVARLRISLDSYVQSETGDNRQITAEVGRSLVEGILAFAEGSYSSAVSHLLPLRYQAWRIGGSHAQRDLLTQTLIVAAERAGDRRLLRALLAERLGRRPTARVRHAYALAHSPIPAFSN